MGRTELDFDETLIHFGIKGMKWGKRRRASSHSPSLDSIQAESARRKAKGGTSSLSNKELQSLVTRMNLERQYSTLSQQSSNKNPAVKFAGEILGNVGKQQVSKIASDLITKQVAKKLGNT